MSRVSIVAAVSALLLVNPLLATAQWAWLSGGPEGIVRGLASNYQTLFAGTAGPGSYFFYISTNQGNSWLIPDSTIMAVNSIAMRDSVIFAGTGGSGVYRSTDRGLNWAHADSGLTNANVDVIVASGVFLFAGTIGGGVFRSTDNGTSWSEANTGLTHPIVISMTLNGTLAFTGTYAGGVFVSSDNGAGWIPADSGLTQSTINDLATTPTAVFAGTANGVFRTTTNGSSWIQMNSGLYDTSALVFWVIETRVFLGTQAGVFLSTNSGGSWTDVSSGLPRSYSVVSLACDSTYLYAGLYYGGVWRRPLSEMITSVEAAISELPNDFGLEQNYPNPFNPSTRIHYGLPRTSFVMLTVYNTLGQQVAQLVNEQQQAGYHGVVFRGDGLASGVYFYRLRAGDVVQTRRMLLVR